MLQLSVALCPCPCRRSGSALCCLCACTEGRSQKAGSRSELPPAADSFRRVSLQYGVLQVAADGRGTAAAAQVVGVSSGGGQPQQPLLVYQWAM